MHKIKTLRPEVEWRRIGTYRPPPENLRALKLIQNETGLPPVRDLAKVVVW